MNAILNSLSAAAVKSEMPVARPHPRPESQHAQAVILADASNAAEAEALEQESTAQESIRAASRAEIANMNASATGIRFRHNDDSNDTQIQIIDQNTDEVIQEFPSSQMLKVMSRIEEVIGRIFDSQA